MKHLRALLPWILCLAITAALLAACGSSESGDESTAKRQFISIGTAPVVGGFYVMGGALAEVLNTNAGPIEWCHGRGDEGLAREHSPSRE